METTIDKINHPKAELTCLSKSEHQPVIQQDIANTKSASNGKSCSLGMQLGSTSEDHQIKNTETAAGGIQPIVKPVAASITSKGAYKTLLYSRNQKRLKATAQSSAQLASASAHKRRGWTIFAPAGTNVHICARIDPERCSREKSDDLHNQEDDEDKEKDEKNMAKLEEKIRQLRPRYLKMLHKRDMSWFRRLNRYEYLKQQREESDDLWTNLSRESDLSIITRFEAFEKRLKKCFSNADKYISHKPKNLEKKMEEKRRKEMEEKSRRISITKRRLCEIAEFLELKYELDKESEQNNELEKKGEDNASNEESKTETDEDLCDNAKCDEQGNESDEETNETSCESEEDEGLLSSSEDEPEHFYDGCNPDDLTIYEWLQKNTPRNVTQTKYKGTGTGRYIRIHRHLLNENGTWMKTSRDVRSSIKELIIKRMAILWVHLLRSGKQITRADMIRIAHQTDETHGLWMLFTDDTRKVEVFWSKIITALIKGRIPSHTVDASVNDGTEKYVIHIRTDDFTNFEEVCAHEKAIRDIGIRGQMLYKIGIHSVAGIYKGHEIRPSIYRSDYDVGIELSRIKEFDE